MTRFGIVLPLLSLLVLCSACQKAPPAARWKYSGNFHRKIVDADRIVVHDGRYDDPRYANKPKDSRPEPLFEIVEPADVRLISETLQFKSSQVVGSCACRGYPRIDWYQQDNCLAVTSVQHCRAIRWNDFPGDAALTKKSSAWLKQWLIVNGIKEDLLQ